MDAYLFAASVILVFLAVLAIICAWELVRLARTGERVGAADERAVASITAAIGASIGGLLGLNRILHLGLTNDVAIGLLVIAAALVGVPSALWLRKYRPDLLVRGVAIAFTGAVLFGLYLLARGTS